MPFFTRSRVLLISWGVNPGDYETTGQGAHSKHRLAGRLKDIATRTFREKEQQMKPRLCIAIACAVACVTCVRNSQAGEVPFGANEPQILITSHDRVYKADQTSNTIPFMIRQAIACSA